jgi:predicted dehydrogenase
MRIQCAFVGCGGVAEHYWNIYRDLDWVEVTVLVDVNREALDRAAEYFSVNQPRPRTSVNFEAALAEDVDVVLVSTPNHFHREQAMAALAAGKHVLLQKPIAGTLADAFAIREAERNATTKCGVYMSYMDEPIFYDLAEMNRRGWFGPLVQMYARYMHTGGMALSSQNTLNWRGSLEKIGGGVFLQLGVHYLHLFHFLSGLRPLSVLGIKDNVFCPNLDGEDIGLAVYDYEEGVKATLDTAWTAQGEEFSIQGTLGSATYLANRWLLLQGNNEPFDGQVIHSRGGENVLLEIPLIGMSVNQPWNQHRRFLEAIRKDTPVPVSVESAVDDLVAVVAFYEAAASHNRVMLADVAARNYDNEVIS